MDDLSKYKGNSHSKHEKSEPAPEQRKPRIEQIVSIPPRVQKQGVWSRVRATFVADNPRSVGFWLVEEVIVPSLKDLLFDVGTKGLERSLYSGSESTRPYSVGRGRSYSQYNRPNTRAARDREPDARPEIDRRDRAVHDFSKLTFRNAGEAERVADSLVDLISEYGVATVGDFYSAIGMTAEFTDHNYGWFDLSAIRVRKIPHGYVMDLPRPEQIDK